MADCFDSNKQPGIIHLPGETRSFEPFAFAGICSYNKNLGNKTINIVTLVAEPQIERIRDRMPSILKGDALAECMSMDPDKFKALELLQENRGPDLVSHTLSKDVSSVKQKGASVIDEVTA